MIMILLLLAMHWQVQCVFLYAPACAQLAHRGKPTKINTGVAVQLVCKYREHSSDSWPDCALTASHHGDATPSGAWTPFECCSPKECVRLPTVCLRKLDVVGQVEFLLVIFMFSKLDRLTRGRSPEGGISRTMGIQFT